MTTNSVSGDAGDSRSKGCELVELARLINEELAAGLCDRIEKPGGSSEHEGRRGLGRYICVEVVDRQMAIPLSSVLEAGELQQVQSLPLLPPWLTGITSIRGEIISVVNLALFLDHKNQSSANVRSFLVVQEDRLSMAITVDRIIGTRVLFGLSETQSVNDAEMAASAPDFSAGCAFYEDQGGEVEIELFDLQAFMSSRKLRDLAGV
jgi:chemotaxis signal transduction protein